MHTTKKTTAAADTQAAQMAAYVEDLLCRQIERLKTYDLDGAMRLAQEAQPLAETLTREKLLSAPELAGHKARIQGLYKELCLVIASQRQEVSDKLSQIRTGLKTLGTYAGK